MKKFELYLLAKQLVNNNNVKYYIAWNRKFYNYYGKQISDIVSDDEIKNYIKQLTNQHESWQIDQAEEAIRLFILKIKKKLFIQIQKIFGKGV